ncbi:MAG: prolipoprotein diacylglyceryl transferase [Chitinophagaceae bacterium]|nr:prolipoprotein diacylglyceryl transferase [Chitinophagaceae bacterium]
MYSFILWNVSPEIFSIMGFPLVWYGLLFASAFLIGQQLLMWMYKKEGKNPRDIETLTIYILVGTVVGARLGHCFFYEPAYFLAHPIEVFYIRDGGLASHGGALGIFIALFIFWRKHPQNSYLSILDRMALGVAIGGCLIRTGNLMNSEIIGKPTIAPTAVLFVHGIEKSITDNFGVLVNNVTLRKVDTVLTVENVPVQPIEVTLHMSSLGNGNVNDLLNGGIKEALKNSGDYYEGKYLVPDQLRFSESTDEQGKKTIVFTMFGVARHPSQVYEAVSCLLLFFVLLAMYLSHNGNVPEGRTFGWFIVVVFSLRFVYEFLKENQVSFENDMSLNMGQILSMPMLVVGLFILIRSYKPKGAID